MSSFRLRWLSITMLALAALASGVTSAAAFDITGTYEGKFKCAGFFDGFKDKFEEIPTLTVTQNGNVVGISWNGGEFSYVGIALPDGRKPDKGEIAFVVCSNNAAPADGNGLQEIARLKVSTKPSKGTATLKGVGIFIQEGDSVFTCKWSFKRTNTSDPGVPTGCA